MLSAFDISQMSDAAANLRQAHDAVDVGKSFLSGVVAAQDGSKWGVQDGPRMFMRSYIGFLTDTEQQIDALWKELMEFSQDVPAMADAVRENDEGAAGAYSRTQETIPAYQTSPLPPQTPPSQATSVATPQ